MTTIPALVEKYEDVFSSLRVIANAAQLFEGYSTFNDLIKISTLEKFNDAIPDYLRNKDLDDVKGFVREYLDTGLPDFPLKELEKKQKEWFDEYIITFYPKYLCVITFLYLPMSSMIMLTTSIFPATIGIMQMIYTRKPIMLTGSPGRPYR